MKSTFVKIEGQNIWFLLVNPNGEFDESLRPLMKIKAVTDVTARFMASPMYSKYELDLRVAAISGMNIDYTSEAAKNETGLLVRENGSYMPLTSIDQITETIEDYGFPINELDIN